MLACTHFPLLLDRLGRLVPWPVDWIDPAPAIARRVSGLIGAPAAGTTGTAQAIFTSGAHPSAVLAAALARFGLRDAVQAAGSSARLSSQPAPDATGALPFDTPPVSP